MKKLLFVSGVARSGTSALVGALNKHPQILIGQERFFWVIKKKVIRPEHFERDRFLDVRADDTHNKNALGGSVEGRNKKYMEALYIGDKFPNLFNHFDIIFERFPEARHIYILRNPLSVLESYDVRHKNPNDTWRSTWRDGMEAWNASISTTANLSGERLEKFVFVRYEEIYSSTLAINSLFAALGLEGLPDGKLEKTVQKASVLNETMTPRRDDLRAYVARHADWDSYRKLCDIMDGHA